MIFGEIAIVLNLLSITAFCVLLLSFVISIVVKTKLVKIDQYSALSRRLILWLITLSPWIAGIIAAALTLLSGSGILPLSEVFDLFHWHHPREFLLNSWHGLLLAFTISGLCLLIIPDIRRLILNARKIRLLHTLAELEQGLYQLESDQPTAFTAGYLRPKSYITSALRNQLSRQQYSIVQLHEAEHAKRYDPFKKWLFQLLAAIFPFGVSRTLKQSMLLAVEQNADSAVSRVFKDKSKIAETLLKVRRISAAFSFAGIDNNAVCHYGHDNIHLRIHYLLSDEKQKALPLFLIVFSVAFMSIMCALSADIFHHLIEYSFSH